METQINHWKQKHVAPRHKIYYDVRLWEDLVLKLFELVGSSGLLGLIQFCF